MSNNRIKESLTEISQDLTQIQIQFKKLRPESLEEVREALSESISIVLSKVNGLTFIISKENDS